MKRLNILRASAALCLAAFVWLVCANAPADETRAEVAAQAEAPPAPVMRQGNELMEEFRAITKKWKTIKPEQAEDAAHDYLSLYEELLADTQLPTPTRKRLQGTVKTRLGNISQTLNRNVAKSRVAPSAEAASATVQRVTLPDDKTTVAAQRGVGNWNSGNVNTDDYDRRGRMGAEQLIEVIKTTISPDSWEDNGGNGTIMYWGAQRYLIIRQTQEVHEQIGGVMGQLRR